MEAEIVQNQDNLTELKPKNNLGNYLVTGGPGRPPGMKNKFTMVKEALVDAFNEAGGAEAFKNTLIYEDGPEGNKKKFINLEALRSVLRVLPREDAKGGNTYNFNIVVQELRQLRPEQLRAIIAARPRNDGIGGGEGAGVS